MKVCNTCNQAKSLDQFPKASTCKDGHRNYCKVCHEVRKTKWRKNNLESVRETQREWVKNNLEKSRAIGRAWAQRNPEYHLEYTRKARKENPKKYRAWVSARRKRAQKATPAWADLKAIRTFYEHCPVGFHVDHIIPLNGEFVSGLHIVDNLQYLPAPDNMRKGAKYGIDV